MHAVGEGAEEVNGYNRAYAISGGEEGIGRPAGVVERWGFGCRQRFVGGRSGSAVLLQEPCGRNEQVFAVTGDFWSVYREAGDAAPDRYGFPLGPRGEWRDGWTQGFGRRLALNAFFMQRPDGPVHVLDQPILDYYLTHDDRDVRFGYPTSKQFVSSTGLRCQQFERAVLTVEGNGEIRSDLAPRGGCS